MGDVQCELSQSRSRHRHEERAIWSHAIRKVRDEESLFFCRINSNNNTSDNFVAGYQRGIHDVIKFRNSEMLDVYLKWTNVS